jgi:hypothetical protein
MVCTIKKAGSTLAHKRWGTSPAARKKAAKGKKATRKNPPRKKKAAVARENMNTSVGPRRSTRNKK